LLTAKALREPSVLFKVVCDVSGRLEIRVRVRLRLRLRLRLRVRVRVEVVCDVSRRLESATRENIVSLMRRGRNL